MAKENGIKDTKINDLVNLDTITKLRLVVITVFALMTLGIILAIINQFPIAATLILISYVLVLALMVKLLIAKKI